MGIPIYIQFGDNEKADYIIIFEGKPLKVQVKSSERFDGEKTIFDLSSSTMHRKNGSRTIYKKEEVDLFVCYDIKTKKCFGVINNGNMVTISIRYKKPKNNQNGKVHFAEDHVLTYEFLKKYINT